MGASQRRGIANAVALKAFVAFAMVFVGVIFLARSLTAAGILPDVTIPWPRRDLNTHVINAIRFVPVSEFRVVPASEIPSSTGVMREIRYQGRVVTTPDSQNRVYCSGVTFDIYMKALELAGGPNFRLRGVEEREIRALRRDWFGVDGNERTFVDGLTSRNLGREITNFADAKPGDFVQFWRTRTGHSVVFKAWAVDDNNRIVGIHYWSAQLAGIGLNHELFQEVGGQVDPERIFIVRAFTP